MKDLTQIIDIIGVDKEIVHQALSSEIKDFEDAIQSISAEYNEIEILIIRNSKDFQESGLQKRDPKGLIERLNNENTAP